MTGYSGNQLVATPYMDQLVSEEGLILDNAYASSSCAPSRAALFTGRDPPRAGVDPQNRNAAAAWGPPRSMTLLPRKLKDAGYATHFAGTAPGVHTSSIMLTPAGLGPLPAPWRGAPKGEGASHAAPGIPLAMHPGKWDAGFFLTELTPCGRGFDSCLSYFPASVNHYTQARLWLPPPSALTASVPAGRGGR